MLKVLSLMKRKEGMSFAEFRNWAQNEHPLLAQKLPGMRGYRMNVPRDENPDSPYDAISEMWFDSAEARAAAIGNRRRQGGRRRCRLALRQPLPFHGRGESADLTPAEHCNGRAVVDAHHHIWRQADVPWLMGPMVPRIFGPYEPLRRDYPVNEFLSDIAGTGVVKSVYVQ